MRQVKKRVVIISFGIIACLVFAKIYYEISAKNLFVTEKLNNSVEEAVAEYTDAHDISNTLQILETVEMDDTKKTAVCLISPSREFGNGYEEVYLLTIRKQNDNYTVSKLSGTILINDTDDFCGFVVPYEGKSIEINLVREKGTMRCLYEIKEMDAINQ